MRMSRRHLTRGITLSGIIGFLIGVVLTIAAAYEFDSRTGHLANGLPSTNAEAPLVNWDVASSNLHYIEAVVRTKVEDLRRRL
jgi:hypothetical protein